MRETYVTQTVAARGHRVVGSRAGGAMPHPVRYCRAARPQTCLRVRRRACRGAREGLSMPVTLADVAQAVGMSASTVSRALSGTAKVNDATREKIVRTARE